MIEVGTEVTIRNWEDMASQYRVSNDKKVIILPEECFLEEMHDACGRKYTVSKITKTLDGHEAFYLKEDIEGWLFTKNMFVEYCNREEEKVVNDKFNIKECYGHEDDYIFELKEMPGTKTEKTLARIDKNNPRYSLSGYHKVAFVSVIDSEVKDYYYITDINAIINRGQIKVFKLV